MNLPSDEQQVALMARIADGDSAALGEFASLTGPWLVAALRRMVEDPEVVDTMTERVFMEVWQMAPLWDRHVGRPLLWVLAMGRAIALEWLDDRRRRRQPGPGSERPSNPGHDDTSAVGACLAQDPAGRDVLEAAWFSHPVQDDSIVLPDAAAVGPALTAFAKRLGGSDGG